MGDLISRKALIERLRELGWLEPDEFDTEIKLVAIINQLPTAFDVEKVINQIENKMFSAECYNDDFNGCEIGNLLCMGDVYEIIKGGWNR